MRKIDTCPTTQDRLNRAFRGVSRYDLVTGILSLCFLLLLGTIGACVIVTKAQAKSTCLALGYRSVEIDASLAAYCIKRVDQTDIVVPIEEAKKGGR